MIYDVDELENYPLLLDVHDLMEITGLSRNHLYRCFAEGSIPAQRMGRLWKVSKEQFKNFIMGKI